jgi:thioesterase domain-containing protein/acyl carrier protein
MNAYGPTECSDDVTQAVITDPPGFAVVRMPIGRPVANIQLYVLDAWMQPVPIGVSGELYIGGVGVGRGYLHDPVKTAQAFVPNLFLHEGGRANDASHWSLRAGSSRLYRTGDLGFWRADGNLVYLGRVDQQVKLRGFRIELGEIESVLGQHRAVRAAVAVVCADEQGEQRLIAYVVPAETLNAERRTINEPDGSSSAFSVQRSALASDLRAFLDQRLPDYMIPAAFVHLDVLPLTPSGKLDRRRLPVPDLQSNEAIFVAPRDATEELLATLWAEVLGREHIGIHDSFFELGGHSLLAVRLLTRVQQATGVQLPLASLFQNATVARQAALLRTSPAPAGWQPLVPIQPHGSARPLFIVHGIGGTVLNFQVLAEALGLDQPLYGLQARGVEDDGEPFDTIQALASAYLAAIRIVQPVGPYRLAGWSFGGLVAFEMACQLVAADESVPQLALLDSRTPQPLGQPATPHQSVLAFAGALGRQLGVAPAFKLALPDGAVAEQLEALMAQGQATGMLDHDVTLAQLQRRFRVFMAHERAAAQYEPPAYGGPLTVLYARDAQGGAAHSDPSLGWETELRRAVAVIAVPGDHYSMLQPPHVSALADHLRSEETKEWGARYGGGECVEN